MRKIGIVGWRGMVGSVLMERMREEKVLDGTETTYFTTSQVGQEGPGSDGAPLLDAHDLPALSWLDIVVTCQGSGYTKKVYADLRKSGWDGYWIDAASALRMDDESVIVLDPVNGELIRDAIAKGRKTFVGGNCTVSLMLMGLLFGWGHRYLGITGLLLNIYDGLAFGVLYLASGRNLWLTVIQHGLGNTLGFVLVYLGLYP